MSGFSLVSGLIKDLSQSSTFVLRTHGSCFCQGPLSDVLLWGLRPNLRGFLAYI